MTMASSNHSLPLFEPSPYKISTITATGGVTNFGTNTHINLDSLYTNITINDDSGGKDEGFMFIEFGKKKSDTYYRGYNKKMTITRRKQKESKRFDNQATVIVRLKGDKDSDACNLVNMKIFKNGNVQMTGLKYISQGKRAIRFLVETLRSIAKDVDPDIVNNVDDLKAVEPLIITDIEDSYRIRLINSDFRIGFDINRDKLYKIMQNEHSMYCSYEPCIYPGVKIQFNWNKQYNNKIGTCDCELDCTGKGRGNGDGDCKKITIAVFQSGCIIITGAQTHEQIADAYNFICCVIKSHLADVYKRPLVPLVTQEPVKEKKKILIKKSNIKQLQVLPLSLSQLIINES